MNIGSIIRRHRKARRLTLRVVSEKAGISEGFLSQVENNVSSPSVDTLMNICTAIGVNAGDILNQVANQEQLVVIRKGEWDDIDLPHTGFATRRFFPPENRETLDSAILCVAPQASIPVRKGVKNGQEILCVLRGALELVHGSETVLLQEGDCAHFWSDHANQKIVNRDVNASMALWVGTL